MVFRLSHDFRRVGISPLEIYLRGRWRPVDGRISKHEANYSFVINGWRNYLHYCKVYFNFCNLKNWVTKIVKQVINSQVFGCSVVNLRITIHPDNVPLVKVLAKAVIQVWFYWSCPNTTIKITDDLISVDTYTRHKHPTKFEVSR